MIYDPFPGIIGRRLTDFFGVYFYSGSLSICPVSIYMPLKDKNWVGVTSDGKGRFKKYAPLTDIYNIPEVGFNFIAPITICFDNFDYHRCIVQDIEYEEQELFSILRIRMSSSKLLIIRSEDDTLTVNLNSY